MRTKFKIVSSVFAISAALGAGLTGAVWLEKGVDLAGSRLSSLASVALVSRSYFATPGAVSSPSPSLVPTAVPKKAAPDYLDGEKIAVPDQGKFILADLGTMSLTLYNDGSIVAEYQIVTKGKPGTAWETPSGYYKILTKEVKHFSSIGQVYMPYSLEFQGNYFIHGWTYYPNGQLVSADFSGGCIKLNTADAKQVFAFADVGTPVGVYNSQKSAADSVEHYAIRNDKVKLNLSAEAYAAVDIKSGEVIAGKNLDKQLPIGSLAKLVTTLVTLDAVNFFKYASVNPQIVQATGERGILRPGESLQIKELLYPMLLRSSNAAALTLASTVGTDNFVQKMSERADAIGLSQTSFVDPTGDSPDNRSSVSDLFKLALHIYNHKKFIFDVTKVPERLYGTQAWSNDNPLAKAPGFIGGQTAGPGEADKQAALNLFSLPLGRVARPVAIAVMGSSQAATDTEQLLNYLKQNVYYGEDPLKAKTSSTTSMVFVGDIMLDRGVKDSINKNGAGDYNYIIDNISKIQTADVLVGNLEGPASDVGKNGSSGFSFRMSPEALSLLKDTGFNVLTVANNHMGDWGRPAFVDTLSRIKDLGMAAVGGGNNFDEAAAPQIVEKNGTRFGFLAFTDVGPTWLSANDQSSGLIMASDPRVPQIIKDAASQVDVLVVSYHFGTEYQKTSSARQKQLAHLAIDNGAKIVVGTHPHVPEEIENYNGGLILYSLGNFIFDQYFSPDTMSGQVVKINFQGKNILDVWKMRSVQDKQFRVKVE